MAELAAEISGIKPLIIPPPVLKTVTEESPEIKPDTGNSPRFNTVGFSFGSSFTTPVVIGSVNATIAPVRNLFLEIGFDIGFIYSGPEEDNFSVEGYYSLYPYAHLGFFLPFAKKGGWYIGAGGGYMIAEYTFSDGTASIDIFAVNLTTGLNIGNLFNFSYTLRTNFENASNKVAVGFVYRFK
jgi:hypothetical protein